MNKKITKIIPLIIFFVGISLLLYPTISQYWNSFVQSKVVTEYDKTLSNIDESIYNDLFLSAQIYNEELSKLSYPLIEYQLIPNYKNLININSTGMMGYITIAKIRVKLPIYHGTNNSVLNTAVGHLEGSSLPIGGNNTHSVLSAHRGLPSSKLFTNLNKLELGDIFEITILNKTLTYQVDKITIIEPNDLENLAIEKDKDYVTLMTCTPYGINTHRLLVRGIRIETLKQKEIIITSDAYQIDKLIVSLIIAIPIITILIIYMMIKPIKKKTNEEEDL